MSSYSRLIHVVGERAVSSQWDTTELFDGRIDWVLDDRISWSALYDGTSRVRLRELMGVDLDDERFVAVNLLPPVADSTVPWDGVAAASNASRIFTVLMSPRLRDRSHPTPRLILLGRRVARAFNLRRCAFLDVVHLRGHELHPCGFVDVVYLRGCEVLLLPHPSGRSRYLNDPRARARCRKTAESFLSF